MRVSVILVSYNTREHLQRCLHSIGSEHEIIVVDNASTDGSADLVAEQFPHVHLIRNETNRGFGAANNQGFAVATQPLLLCLNSDAEATPGAIEELAKVFDDPMVIAAGGRLTDTEGNLQPSCCSPLTLWAVFCEQFFLEKLFPSSPLLSPYWLSERLLRKGMEPHVVSQVMGACLMLRSGHQFDESYFLYCEDTELCYRLAKKGALLYVPKAVFRHALGASSSGNRWWSVAMYNAGKERFFRQHHGSLPAVLCWLLDRLGALLRMIVWILRGNRTQAKLFRKVLCAPFYGPALPPDAVPKASR